MFLGLAVVRPRVPLVITHHGDVVRQKALKKVLQPFEHLLYRRAARVICSSPTFPAGSELLQQYAPKVVVLPFGLDLAPYLRPAPAALEHARRLRAEHGGPLWLAVGRLIYYKGLHVAIRALAGAPGKLMVIGDGPLKAELMQLAAATGVADRVVWKSWVSSEELVGAYQAATALWFPSNSRGEAFGLVQVEAMASGCPVLNANVPGSGVPWVSRHEESGFTVPVDDPKAFADAATRLAREPGLRDRLAAGARDRARRDFGLTTMAQRSFDIYQAALAGAVSDPRCGRGRFPREHPGVVQNAGFSGNTSGRS
jgi:rhamnosyl/mannosyltransferase